MRQRVFAVTTSLLLLALAALRVAPSEAQEPATVVSSTADSGPGTLREALERATPGTTVSFDPVVFPPHSPATIRVTSALPELGQGDVAIDGSNAGVILDGSELPRQEPIPGLFITSSGNVVRGLQILHFPGDGISLVRGARNNIIGGDRTVGIGPSGQGNVISLNAAQGVTIGDPASGRNIVAGNYVGTDPSGSTAWGNGGHGVMIQRSADNRIGGAAPGERNVISGNEAAGVRIEYPESLLNVVIGNYIGTDATGTAALGGNLHSGVAIEWGASENRIGGLGEGERNIISGNGATADGVHIGGPGTDHNLVIGNYIGLDASGTQPLPNSHGVSMWGGASYNTVQGNVVSAAQENPNMVLWDSGTSFNVIIGNLIGTDASGTVAIPGAGGIGIRGGASSNRIGGSAPGAGNVISGHISTGVDIIEGSVGNTIVGNLIGTDISGRFALPNGTGVLIRDAQDNVVGGRDEGERNVISGNQADGVAIEHSESTGNAVIGNYIGTDVTGTAAVGNGERGVFILDGAKYTVVSSNVISGNGNDGVPIEGEGTMYNTVSDNYIGTDSSGTAAIGNLGDGVYVAYGAQDNVITDNLISSNRNNGVQLRAGGTMRNVVSGNYVGTDVTGEAALGNLAGGVVVTDGAGPNTVGPRNVIAFNEGPGVVVDGSDTLGNRITGNLIHQNEGLGIRNSAGGNAELAAPVITYVGTRLVRGTAPANSSVEMFSDEEDEGRVFEGSSVAYEEGSFAFRLPVGRFTVRNITATATDEVGNTSQFSPPASPPAPRLTRELPGLVGPAQVSVEPKVLGTNLALALFCVVFFGLTSTIFNRILTDFRDELLGAFRRLVPRRLAGLPGRVGVALGSMRERGWGAVLAIWLVVLLVTSLIESFLDPEVGAISVERLGIWLTLFVAAVTVSGLELGSDLAARRRLAPALRVEARIQWIGIAAAVGCVILSRALDFRPGYLYGFVGAAYLLPKVAGIADSGKRAVLVLGAVFSGVFLMWLVTAFLPSVLAELEALLLTTFLIGLQGVFFELLPLAVTEGGDIWNWRRAVWFVFFLAVFFCFYHFVLNPNASDVQALQQNGVQTVLILIVVFGLATLILWLLFPLRLARRTR